MPLFLSVGMGSIFTLTTSKIIFFVKSCFDSISIYTSWLIWNASIVFLTYYLDNISFIPLPRCKMEVLQQNLNSIWLAYHCTKLVYICFKIILLSQKFILKFSFKSAYNVCYNFFYISNITKRSIIFLMRTFNIISLLLL